MIRLNLQKEPYWLDLVEGVRLKVRPLTTVILSAAQARASRVVADQRKAAEEAREAGMATPEQEAFLEDEDLRRGVADLVFAKALARYAVIDWEGIGNASGDAPAPVTEENVARLMEVPSASKRFLEQYQRSLNEALAEGNASGLGPNGISAPGPATATDAAPKGSPAPAADEA